MNDTTMNIMPPRILRALNHVREHHPLVRMVVFDTETKWLYVDDNHHAPTFGPEIDVGILEDAVNDLTHVPCAFAPREDGSRDYIDFGGTNPPQPCLPGAIES